MDTGQQCRPRSDAENSTLFVLNTGISKKNMVIIKSLSRHLSIINGPVLRIKIEEYNVHKWINVGITKNI